MVKYSKMIEGQLALNIKQTKENSIQLPFFKSVSLAFCSKTDRGMDMTGNSIKHNRIRNPNKLNFPFSIVKL